jgi:hypothetical protein
MREVRDQSEMLEGSSTRYSVLRTQYRVTREFRYRLLPLALVSLFLAAHVVVPLVWGDVYPFTSAPMFRDRPEKYCNYRVFAPDGAELPREDWLLQRVYDGNPVGYGVGISPPAVIEQEFGVIPKEREVREHILRRYKYLSSSSPSYVDVEQWVFGPTSGTIGRLKVSSWRIHRPTP